MDYEEELNLVIPADLPHRETVIGRSARHLKLMEEANRHFNLTRITTPRDAAIKHVLDSVLPWRHFAGAKHVLDAGTGAGFPGIPLALTLPETRFTLVDSIGKKARFVQDVIADLEIANAEAAVVRAEEFLRHGKVDVITGRAVAPLDRACALFGPALRNGARALLYKGPDAEAEIQAAAAEAKKQRVRLRVISRHELPDGLGTRTLVEISG